ncbi:hypothetical protein AHAS_Ahas15G0141500 [Arachis hypogaea]
MKDAKFGVPPKSSSKPPFNPLHKWSLAPNNQGNYLTIVCFLVYSLPSSIKAQGFMYVINLYKRYWQGTKFGVHTPKIAHHQQEKHKSQGGLLRIKQEDAKRSLCRASWYDCKEMDGPLDLLFVWTWKRISWLAPIPQQRLASTDIPVAHSLSGDRASASSFLPNYMHTLMFVTR